MDRKVQGPGFSSQNVKNIIFKLIMKLIGGTGNNLFPFLFL